MVMLLGRMNLTFRYWKSSLSEGASPVVQGKLSSRIHAANSRRNPVCVASIAGLSSPLQRYSRIRSADCFKLSFDGCSSSSSELDGFASSFLNSSEFFFLHFEM